MRRTRYSRVKRGCIVRLLERFLDSSMANHVVSSFLRERERKVRRLQVFQPELSQGYHLSSQRIMVAPLRHENTAVRNFYPLCVFERESDPRRTLLLGISHRFSLIYAFRSGLEKPTSSPTIHRAEKETTEMSSSISGCGVLVPPFGGGNKGRS